MYIYNTINTSSCERIIYNILYTLALRIVYDLDIENKYLTVQLARVMMLEPNKEYQHCFDIRNLLLL